MGLSSLPQSESSASSRFAWLKKLSSTLAPLTFLLLLSLVLSFIAPNFATRENLKAIAVQSAVIAILACGQTVVIISGNIDLSVGAMMAFSGVVAADAMMHHSVAVGPAILLAILAGLAAGTITGLITAFGKIPSFIVTLGMMGVYYGAGGYIAGSRNIGGFPDAFRIIGTKELFGSDTTDGIPYGILIMVLVAVSVSVLLSRTQWGRNLYAIGGNREAARLSGINLTRSTVTIFALSGLLAGIAAVLNVSRTGIAAFDAGNSYELYAVAATVIGGTSLFGGQGGIPGTIIGALLMFTIRNGCALKNVNTNLERAIIGAVVILAVLYDRYGPGKKSTRR